MDTARRALIVVATALVLVVVVLDLLSFAGWPDSGPVAVAGAFAEHLTVAALIVGIPTAFLHEAGRLRLAIVVLVVLSLVRFGGEWLSIPDGTPEATPRLGVATWEIDPASRTVRNTIEFLRSASTDVIALQALTPDVSAAIAADLGLARRFPYQSLYPRSDALGLGLLSRYPVSAVDLAADSARLSVLVDAPVGRILVANVHPDRGGDRRATLSTIRAAFVDDGSVTPVLLLGDILIASSEPSFGWFTAGFRDAHAEVGTGPGWTYRPDALDAVGIPLLRTDVVLAGPGLRPVAESTDCPSLGEHCAVLASVVADPSR